MGNVTITLDDGTSKQVPGGTAVGDLVAEAQTTWPVVGALVNNELMCLHGKLEVNARVSPVTLDSDDGQGIYRRSICFLLAAAARKIYPERRLMIGHSLGSSYYYHFYNHLDLHDDEVDRLGVAMRELVAADLPIDRVDVSYPEALATVRAGRLRETEKLLEFRNEGRIPMYRCGDYADLAHGPLVNRTGLLGTFELRPYPPGFLLRYPTKDKPNEVPFFSDIPVLFSIYQEYKAWGKILGIQSVGSLNRVRKEKEIQEFIRVAEALHDKKISEIADKIHARRSTARAVLIAGPSSSGKTTFTKKLAIQLKVLGFNPVAIGLDDYFKEREETPKDADGNYDFESLDAIDVELLNDHLLRLFRGEEVAIPSFDFKAGGKKYEGRTLKLGSRTILLMEGIHGLNDRLTPLVSRENKFKIYISALTQLNLDDHNRISTTDNRLIRRMVRDSQFRGYSAKDTLERWPSVRNGEDRNIFPYQGNADTAFNSALDYELAVLKMFAEPLLRSIKPGEDVYGKAVQLMEFLHNIAPIPARTVPDDSILREFIGGSTFKY